MRSNKNLRKYKKIDQLVEEENLQFIKNVENKGQNEGIKGQNEGIKGQNAKELKKSSLQL